MAVTNDDEVTLEPERSARLRKVLEEEIPFNRALGMEVLELAHGEATMRVRHAAHLAASAERGELHAAVVSSLLDATCAAAVLVDLGEGIRIATLDLRIDRFGRCAASGDVVARASLVHCTQDVAFVQGVASCVETGNVIARAASAFVLIHAAATEIPGERNEP